ncbi:MAG: LLM class flavin-dependent oxidoreductase [Actinomycetota bacterium]
MLEISCAFATGLDTPDHVVLAEELGYRRAWLYDSPALYADVWMTLALAAQRTGRIHLGPGVVVPHLRHPMTTAAAIAHLETLAPGRVEVAVGSGFTGRLTMGQRPLRWSFVRDYVACVQELLAGGEPEWDGAPIAMLHVDGFAPRRPIDVPFLLGADGPKGRAVAAELGDGIFTTQPIGGFDRCAVLTFGTVLEEGESPGSDRALAAAGHGAAVVYHALLERHLDLAMVPGGPVWAEAVRQVPERRRHLEVHRGHLVELNEHDRPVVGGDVVAALTFTGERLALRARLDQLAEAGATEIAFQPAGPDIPRELEAFAEMAADLV